MDNYIDAFSIGHTSVAPAKISGHVTGKGYVTYTVSLNGSQIMTRSLTNGVDTWEYVTPYLGEQEFCADDGWARICRMIVVDPTPTPAPGTGKEYVFEFSAMVVPTGIILDGISKLVKLLGGKSSYVEGNKLVVVM